MKNDRNTEIQFCFISQRSGSGFSYGYTTATYSGRMPCSEIADSIVQISRRTLERSISYIEEHPKYEKNKMK